MHDSMPCHPIQGQGQGQGHETDWSGFLIFGVVLLCNMTLKFTGHATV